MSLFLISGIKKACESKLTTIRSVRGKMLKELAVQNPLPGEHPKSMEAAYFQEDVEDHVLAILSYARDAELHGDPGTAYISLTLSEYKPLQGHFPRERSS